MIIFDVNTYIYRPLKQVFAFVATPENDFHWQYGTLQSIRVADVEMGVGALFRSVSNFMGRRMESIYQVTEYEPDKKYGFKSQSGPIVVYTLYAFEVMKGSTRIDVFARIIPGALVKHNDVSAERRLRKQYRENLTLLKDLLEERPIERATLAPIAKRHNFP
jgi:hypothetical protein